MSLSNLLFNFDEDFVTFKADIGNNLLQSGLLLDEHEDKLIPFIESNKIIQHMICQKRTNGSSLYNLIQNIISNLLMKYIIRYYENNYKYTFENVIKCCRNQSVLNVNVKRHFERRLSFIKVLDITDSLKESTLLQEEVKFLNEFSLLLTQSNKSMMKTKEAIINSKMNSLCFQIFETNYSRGTNIDECVDILKITADTFVYNSSEFLTALVLSFLNPFKSNDAVTFHNLNVVIPIFLQSFNSSLEESAKIFENTKYLLSLKHEPCSSATSKRDTKLTFKNLVNYQLNESLMSLQICFDILTKMQKNFDKSSNVSDIELETVEVCLKKSLQSVLYLDKLTHSKSIKPNEDVNAELLPSTILIKDTTNLIVSENTETKQIDEVFSCYISDNKDLEASSIKQYDDLFQNYTSQKMLIVELQEKLDLLTNLKGRKIAPDPGDQLLPPKEETSKVVPNIIENNKQESTSKIIHFLLAPPPPKLPVFNLLLENNSNYSTTKSLAFQVKQIANKIKRDEEVFGSDNDDSSESAVDDL